MLFRTVVISISWHAFLNSSISFDYANDNNLDSLDDPTDVTDTSNGYYYIGISSITVES